MKDRVIVTIFCISKITTNTKRYEVECDDMIGASRCMLTWKAPRYHDIVKYEIMELERLV